MNTTLNTVRLPEQLGLRREPSANEALSKNELEKFDALTLFYDVFLDQTGKRLVAIGPPANNLADYVAAAKLTIDGRAQRFKFRDLPDYKLSILEANVAVGTHCLVEFSFADFKATFQLNRNQEARGKRILAAISKDNAPEWVATWADFHRHNYDIDEVIVYDNGSNNIDEPRHTLRGKAQIIEWKFPYGPPGRRFNKFAQPGALNHCLRKFCKDGTLFNFDIDELLIADKKKLFGEINRNGTLYLDSYYVPKTQPLKHHHTHYDFKFREPNKVNKARKFVCLENSVDIISQHNTWKKSPILNYRRTKPEKLESRHAYFLHFLAITTNWEPSLGKLNMASESRLQMDISHIEKKPI